MLAFKPSPGLIQIQVPMTLTKAAHNTNIQSHKCTQQLANPMKRCTSLNGSTQRLAHFDLIGAVGPSNRQSSSTAEACRNGDCGVIMRHVPQGHMHKGVTATQRHTST
jgi:hypothetical protein